MNAFSEPLVARVTGVKKHRLVDARKAHLEKGPDWHLVNSVVHYSSPGLQKLLDALGLDRAALGLEKNAPAPAPCADGTAASAAPAPEARLEPSPASGEASARQATPFPAAQEVGENEVTTDTPPAPAFARRDPAATATAIGAEVNKLERRAPAVLVTVIGLSPNTSIVRGRLDDGQAVVVRVRHNNHFVPGLVIRARRVNAHNFYIMEGRPPRWKGDRFGFTRDAYAKPTPEDRDDE